jgi:hypothetical protein
VAGDRLYRLTALAGLLLAGCATLPGNPARDCDQGIARGCLALGRSAGRRGELGEAEKAFARACALGSSVGCEHQGKLALDRNAPADAQAAFARGCALGSNSACYLEGDLGLKRGDLDAAREGFGHVCDKGYDDACVLLGRGLLAHGQLDLADPPLERARSDGFSEAWPALVELSERRGDRARAEHLRWEGVAVDQPPVVIGGGLRLNSRGGAGGVVTAVAQPFDLEARRIRIGALLAFGAAPTEVDASFGYQYFVNEFVIPYADFLVGVMPHQDGLPTLPNAGGELGLKLSLPPIGDLNLAIGSSRASPFHATFAIDLHWIIALEAISQVH